MLSRKGKLLFKRGDICHESGSRLTRLPDLCKLVRGAGHFVLESRIDDPIGGVGQRGEEVGRGLTVGAVVTQIREIALSGVCQAEVYLSALVEDGDLVKDLSSGLC